MSFAHTFIMEYIIYLLVTFFFLRLHPPNLYVMASLKLKISILHQDSYYILLDILKIYCQYILRFSWFHFYFSQFFVVNSRVRPMRQLRFFYHITFLNLHIFCLLCFFYSHIERDKFCQGLGNRSTGETVISHVFLKHSFTPG